MPWTSLRDALRSSTPRHRAIGALALSVALLLPGCIASQGETVRLSAAEGSGDIVLHLALEDGQLTSGQAWWADQAPQLAVDAANTIDRWEAIVLKNDVTLAREPLQGTSADAVFTWRSSEAGAVAQAGDVFEVLVVNATDGGTVASYELEISP